MNNDSILPVELRKYMDEDESVYWHGRPIQGVRLTTKDFFLIPFTLIWCGFALFWESMALNSGNLFLILWGIPFVCAGLYMVIGRFFYESHARKNKWLAITNKRVLIVTNTISETCISLPVQGLEQITIKYEGPPGSGSILFGNPTRYGKREIPPPTFEGIEEVRRVYDLVRKAQAPDRQPTLPDSRSR